MHKSNDLQQWLLGTPFGRNILAAEEAFYHNTVQNIFGYYCLQVGLEQINFLANNKIVSKFIINDDIKCNLHFLPFANNSIDLIICPHSLEITEDYHFFLQECYRILIPKGKIIISSFNPKSLLGLLGKDHLLKQINYISIHKLQQHLYRLGFNICGGKFFNYLPPLYNDNYLLHCEFLNKIGDRWFPTFANCYALVGSKELASPTLITNKREFNPQPLFAPRFGVAG